MLQVALKNDNGVENQIFYNHLKLKRFTTLIPTVIAITSLYSPERRRIERFIEAEFKCSYNATITQHYSTLMSVQDDEGNILGALGFRYADAEPLFLEQYLEVPIEEQLFRISQVSIDRNKIVEVGNLASHGNGASIFLFTALTAYLSQQGREVISVTATDSLHNFFNNLNIGLDLLGYANQYSLPDSGVEWGSYYQSNPRIVSGYVEPSYSKLQQYLRMRLVVEPLKFKVQLHQKVRI